MTDLEQRTLSEIVKRQKAVTTGPTLREVAKALGYRGPYAVQRHVKALRQAGLLEKESGRGLTVKKA